MSELVYTLLTDGSSDTTLIPILNWLLKANGLSSAIQGQWADLRWLGRRPTGLIERIGKSLELYPCNLLFVHRDAEREPRAARHEEIQQAVAAVPAGSIPAWVAVIPVRMQEAWLLFDEAAIRQAAGNPSGRMQLELPPLADCEGLPDPKALLYDRLRRASGLGARRREKMNVSRAARRIPDFIDDFGPLRTLPAFRALEADIGDAIRRNRWNRV